MKKALLLYLAFGLFALTSCGGGGSGSGGTGPTAEPAPYINLLSGNSGERIGVAEYDNLSTLSADDATALGYQKGPIVGAAAPKALRGTSGDPDVFDSTGGYGADDITIKRTQEGFVAEVGAGYFLNDYYSITLSSFKEFDQASFAALISTLKIPTRNIAPLVGKYNIASDSAPSFFVNTYVAGEKNSYKGTLTNLHMLMLGGEKANLEYADFGGWLSVSYFNGKVNGTEQSGYNFSEMMPVWNGMEANKANIKSLSGPHTFTGYTTAYFNRFNESTQTGEGIIMSGTAVLDVNTTINTAVLGLTFPNFYKFGIDSVLISDTGSMDNQNLKGVRVTVINNNNNTWIDLTDETFHLDNFAGQFFGSAANNPTEAVGSYRIQADFSSSAPYYDDISGSFGVRK